MGESRCKKIKAEICVRRWKEIILCVRVGEMRVECTEVLKNA